MLTASWQSKNDMKPRRAEQSSRALTMVQALTTVMVILLAGVQSGRAQFTFSTNNGSITITGYTGSGGVVTIPGATNGYTVTGIGEGAFAYCTNVTAAYFLGNSPPDDGTAFYGDPEAVVYYPLGSNGWSETFGGAPTMGETPASEFEYSIYDGSITILHYNGLGSVVVIPSYINGYPVTSIGNGGGTFFRNVTSVTIPNTVTSIGEGAFGGSTGLTSIMIPDSVISIGQEAFAGCGLTSITIPDSVISIGQEAFMDSISLTSVTIPNSVTSIGQETFKYCSSLTSITIPNGVTSIGAGAFQYCTSLTSVTIPESVTNIGYDAFGFCTSLTSVTIFSGLTIIGEYAFQSCTNLASITIPGSVTNIEEYAFYGCIGLTNISVNATNPAYSSINGVLFDEAQDTLVDYPQGLSGTYTVPNGVASIGGQAFYGCTSLTSITIPGSVTNIEEYAFYGCTGLTNISVNATNPAYSSINGVLFDEAQDTLVEYPPGLSGTYIVPNGVASIGSNAFQNCTSLTGISIPGSVASIGADAFYGCGGLTNVIIANGVTSIGYQAFQSCSSLTSISIPGSVTNFGADAFYSCGGLTNVTLANGVTIIGSNAFQNCTSLTSISIPGSVVSIEADAFYGCGGLTNVTLANGVTSIGYQAFQSCSSLTSVTIPGSVTSLGPGAFYSCDSLAYVTLANGITNIGSGVFGVCPSLLSLTIPSSVTGLGINAFVSSTHLTAAYFQGNAPPDDGTAFTGDPATVYYLPGTTGWGATFGGVPAVLWNPRATALTTVSGQFGFNITGPTNAAIVVEACTNLSNPVWLPVSTNVLSGSGVSSFSDAQWTNYPNRYYRFSAP